MTQRARKLHRLFDNIADLSPEEQAAALAAERPSVQHELNVLLMADAKASARSLEHRVAAQGEPNVELTQSIVVDNPYHDNDTMVTMPTASLAEQSAQALSSGKRGVVLAPGTRIEQYEVIREIGRGGMGAVYLARDTKLGRKVAIKFLDANAGAGMVQRFVMEARATARCTHENIVVIHDVSVYGDHPYMVLEYLRGKPLSKLMKDGRIAPNRAVELVAPVVRALIRAHAADIVHRDLKPDNIVLTDTGVIKVLDFGIAKLVREPGVNAGRMAQAPKASMAMTEPSLQLPGDLTQHGALIGTMSFMSPEQWHGRGIDHRTDIWAIGIMLYIMVTGQHPLAPFRGMQLAITGLVEQPMPSAKDAQVKLPARLADIIDTCLRKRKDERYASAEDLLEALEELLPGRLDHADLDAGESPYAGLTAFQEADADRFFGRSREIANVLARVHDMPLLAVVGPSGVGKSSFVRAGVVPALKRSGETWESVVVRPGRHPLAALANIIAPLLTGDSASLSDRVAEHQSVLNRLYAEPGYLGTVLRQRAHENDRKIVLFIDQFEELYTLSPDQRERLAFTACLSGMADDPTSPLRVIVSIRSDFLDRVAEDERLMNELSQGLYFLTPPGRQGLRDALVQPAEMLRYRFETQTMVEHMLDELERTPGSLPLLQFTAAKLWDQRDTRRRLLTEQSYHNMGGIVGALASHADAVLSTMTRAARGMVRTILLRLVTPERTRAIASVSELRELSHQPDAVERLVAQLVDARLLVVQRGDAAMGASVEIVHESMIHSWPTLTRWLDESQEDSLYLEQLRTAARQWDGKGRPVGLLWRGETVAEARRWHSRYRGKLNSLLEGYLQAVFAQEQRSARLRRGLLVGSFAFLVALVAAAAVALVMIRDAQLEAKEQLAAAQQKERARVMAEARAHDASNQAEMSREALAAKNIELAAKNTQLAESVHVAETAREEAEEQRNLAQMALGEAQLAKEGLRRALTESEDAKKRAEQASVKLEEQLAKEKRRVAKLEATGIKPTKTLK